MFCPKFQFHRVNISNVMNNDSIWVFDFFLLLVFRSMWQNDIFGMTSEDDVIALLNIYSCSLAEKKPGKEFIVSSFLLILIKLVLGHHKTSVHSIVTQSEKASFVYF